MSNNSHDLQFETKAVSAGQHPDPSTGAIMTPVYLSSTYVQPSPGSIKENYDYSRSANPTRKALEHNFAALESASNAICFSSGCAALCAVMHLLQQGHHVILGDDVYGGTFRIFDKVFKQFGVTYTQLNTCDTSEIERGILPNTKLVWLETPTNPLLKITDIESVAKITTKKNIYLAVDNTFATPYLQNPLQLGADIVSHSTTKYLGGHSDLIGGVLMVNDDKIAEKLYFVQNAVGAVPSPFDCFLMLRSTKTLHLRVQRHCENASRIADFLSNHKNVSQVIYPGLTNHPQHSIAKKQMQNGFGGMITIYLKGDLQNTKLFLESLHIFSLAESLGGVESLIEHPAIMTHSSIPNEKRQQLGISDNMIRLSVGVENYLDLIDDLTNALNKSF